MLARAGAGCWLAARRWARRGAVGRAGAQGRAGGRRTLARAQARSLGARAGQGCALSALGLVLARFDSVLFLSRFLDIVREPGSLTLCITNFFEKKKKKLCINY